MALELRPGETGTADLSWASEGAVKRILGAILPGLNGEPDRVLKAFGDDRFVPTPVHLGERGRRYAEVLHGLALGDQVVAQGTFLLEAEANRVSRSMDPAPWITPWMMDHSTMDHSMDHSGSQHHGSQHHGSQHHGSREASP